MTTAFNCPIFELQLKSADNELGQIVGIASGFGAVDSQGDTVQRGAYAKTLADHQMRGSAPAMLWQHQLANPVGRWTSLVETPRGLLAAGTLNLRTTGGEQAYQHLLAGDVHGLSIGFQIPAGGFENRAGVRLLKQLDLHEISIVSLAADQNARVTSVKSADLDALDRPETQRELERFLHQIAGFSKTRSALLAKHGWRGEEDGTDLSVVPLADLQELAGLLVEFRNSLKVKP